MYLYILIPCCVLGLCVCITYAFLCCHTFESDEKIKLWGNVHSWIVQRMYIVSIVIAAIANINLWYFYVQYSNPNEDIIYLLWVGVCIYLFFSIFWAPLLIYHDRGFVDEWKNELITFVLGMVSIGSFCQLAFVIVLWMNRKDDMEHILALVSAVYIVVQSFILDFILWNPYWCIKEEEDTQNKHASMPKSSTPNFSYIRIPTTHN